MPPGTYTLIHRGAALTAEERDILVQALMTMARRRRRRRRRRATTTDPASRRGRCRRLRPMSRWDGVTITLPTAARCAACRRRPIGSTTCPPCSASAAPAGAGACGGASGLTSGRPRPRPRRKAMLAALMAGPTPPGVLGYLDDRPVGWCAVAPRAEYPRMQASATFGPVDEHAGVGGVVPVHPSHGAPPRRRCRTRRGRRGHGHGLRRDQPSKGSPSSPVPSGRPTSTPACRRCSSPSGSPRSPAGSPTARSSDWRSGDGGEERRRVARRRQADQPRPAAVRGRRARPSASSSTTSTPSATGSSPSCATGRCR